MIAIRRASILAVILTLALTSSVNAYSLNVYKGYQASESPQNYTCVAASALTHIDYITGSTDVSNATVLSYYSYGRSHIRYSYSTQGLDPRAWAWILYHESPSGYTFNDYGGTYSGQYNQSKGDSELVYGVRETGQPVGALVDRGRHAFDVVGFSSSFDPDLGPYTLNGFYVIDPWYPMSQWTGYDGGVYGLSPDTYISISNWNAHYFRPYSDSQFATIWDGYYVVVARMNSTNNAASPADTPVAGPWADYHSGANIVGTDAAPAPSGTPVGALIAGLWANNLLGANPMGLTLAELTIGPVLHVESGEPDFPSYSLVQLNSRGTPVAVAMVTEDDKGYAFGSLRRISSKTFELPRLEDAEARMGVRVSGIHLKWAWSAESGSPFFPVWSGTESSGREVTMSLDGVVGYGLHTDH